MSKTENFLAIDLGAESGRGIIGSLNGERLNLEVVHRFPNGASRVGGSLFWDVLKIQDEIKKSIGLAWQQTGEITGVGVDTWGVDFGLLGRGDVLLGNPYHYRDAQTNGVLEHAFEKVPGREIFRRTGSQIMQINTLYQLLAMVMRKSPLIESAETMLLMPTLFSYWLSGAKVAEFTHATTSQCLSPETGDWEWKLIEEMGIPVKIFPKVVQAGTVLGPMLGEVAEETGARGVQVIATASHDTAAAVAATPTTHLNYGFISSGTWSVTGVETERPVLTDQAYADAIANEGCYGGTFRFIKNVMGLWLIQETRREWAREGDDLAYDEIVRLANEAQPFKCFIDANSTTFLAPGDMPGRIREYCLSTGQSAPATKGEIARSIFEGLALCYRANFEGMEKATGRHLDVIHIVGGGSQNKLLCQFTANATGKPVIAGPVEATAAGNVLVQAIATGAVGSIEEARQIVRNSFELETFEPRETAAWDEAYAKFMAVTSK